MHAVEVDLATGACLARAGDRDQIESTNATVARTGESKARNFCSCRASISNISIHFQFVDICGLNYVDFHKRLHRFTNPIDHSNYIYQIYPNCIFGSVSSFFLRVYVSDFRFPRILYISLTLLVLRFRKFLVQHLWFSTDFYVLSVVVISFQGCNVWFPSSFPIGFSVHIQFHALMTMSCWYLDCPCFLQITPTPVQNRSFGLAPACRKEPADFG